MRAVCTVPIKPLHYLTNSKILRNYENIVRITREGLRMRPLVLKTSQFDGYIILPESILYQPVELQLRVYN